MSLKNDINQVGQSLKNDQTLLENAFRLEVLIKRYKKPLIAIAVILIIGIIAYVSNNLYSEHKAKKSSEILAKIIENPSDEALLQNLKDTNPPLYDLLSYRLKGNDKQTLQNLLNSNNDFIKELAKYELTSMEENKDGLESNTNNQTLKDMASIQIAYLLLQEGKISEAKSKLESIPNDSPLVEIKKMLSHYQGIK